MTVSPQSRQTPQPFRPQPLAEMTGLTPLSQIVNSQNPQAVYSELRARWGQVAPVELMPRVNGWLVMGHAEICQVARNERLFSHDPRAWREYTSGVIPPDAPLAALLSPLENAVYADGEKHRRLRAPVEEGFDNLDEHRLRRTVEQVCMGLIDEFSMRGEADLVTEYSAAIPMLVMLSLLGVSSEDREKLRATLLAGIESYFADDSMQRMLVDLVQQRRAQPQDDLTSLFVRHPSFRGDDEVLHAMMMVIGMGYEVTGIWIAMALQLMLTDHRFTARLRGGRLGIDEALDEVLWRDPPVANLMGRYAAVDCELAGKSIRRGDAVILSFAAGNADFRVRTNDPWLEVGNRAYLSFSAGSHACPAQRAARLITRLAVETALYSLDDISVTVPVEKLTFTPSLWNRNLTSLPVRFTPVPAAHR
ncbi:cytochrome P450 [Saccharomonospora cyanea]|uniref:Cytochrome P450 n=1 Tax=Saccharomonospora cyanea NA-134 TaxID=882082 RepID=H5XP14_9PSEU|nr:cytochrome P450 [Saccharomonospora cyanea]EHR63263.1 cytochrome P450 [Saccharomonospora cyanea NA-134]